MFKLEFFPPGSLRFALLESKTPLPCLPADVPLRGCGFGTVPVPLC